MNPALMAAITAASKKKEGDAAPTATVEVGEGAGWAALLSLLALASVGASLVALLKYAA